MKFFIHPLIIPFYSFCLMAELERQSYAIAIKPLLIMLGVMFVVLVLYPYFTRFSFGAGKDEVRYDGLFDVDASLRTRAIYAFTLTSFYIAYAFMVDYISNMGSEFGSSIYANFQLWGYKYLFYLFLAPLWVNLLSGKGFVTIFPKYENFFLAKINVAPSAYIGTMAGLILMLGYRSGNDTFWPFVIALWLFAFSCMYHVNKNFQRFSYHSYSFLFGIVQAVLILSFCK